MRLSQVFANLLNNAAKYSDSGGSIELIAEVDDDIVHVRVRDQGIGLSAEQARDIFELFSQADTASNAPGRTRHRTDVGATACRDAWRRSQRT